ncbi:MAG TPA: TonB-dependent receptor, partial [Puia sp.]|nr:TonB-dependent receptor [Puia sp.]
MRIVILLCCAALAMPALTIAQNDTTHNVQNLLKLSLEDLMNIKVVTPSGYLQNTAEAPATITVITAQQIEDRGYEQLEDALRDVPGIDMIHINGYAPTLIYFRGMYGAENLRALLMIDGIPENNILGSNDMAGPAYNLHNVERIEIVWGPVSSLYGAFAFGGVINLITKKGRDIQGMRLQAGFGAYNTSFAKVAVGARKAGLEFQLSGNLFSTDGPVFTNRDPRYSSSYVDKAYSFNGAVSYEAKHYVTTLGFRTSSTPMGWGTYSNSPTAYLGLPAQGNKNLGIVGVMQRNFNGERSGLDDPFYRTLFIQQEYKPSAKLEVMARLIYRETGTGQNSYIYVTADGHRMIRSLVASYSNRVMGDLKANYAISTRQHLSAGLDFYQDNVERGARKSTFDPNTVFLVDGVDTVVNLHSTFLPRTADIRNNFGGYAQYTLGTGWLGNTDFTAAMRFDKNSYFGESFNPRLAIVNRPSDKLTVKLQYGTAFRPPTNLEIYQTPGGNFKLKPERIHTYEVNLQYVLSNRARLQVNGFRNELRDVIVLANLSGLTPDKNPGLINITGIESVLDLAFDAKLTGFLNFTWQDPEGKNL